MFCGLEKVPLHMAKNDLLKLGSALVWGVRCVGAFSMKMLRCFLICSVIGLEVWCAGNLRAQDAKPSGDKQADKAQPSSDNANEGRAYTGMYSFLKDGEFLQLTVEDGGSVTGFVSRFGDGDSDKGAFLDQFLKAGKLDGNKLTFTTDVVHGVAFDFQGTVDRGEGKNPGEEGYYVLKGTLRENISDANKKVTSRSKPVLFKMFPQDGTPAPAHRN